MRHAKNPHAANSAIKQTCRHEQGRGGPLALVAELLFEAVFERRPDGLERGRVAIEVLQASAHIAVDSGDGVAQGRAEAAWRGTADDRRQRGAGAALDPDLEIADLEPVEVLVALDGERVVDEVLDRGEHAGDEVAVAGGRVGADGEQQQTGLAVDEQDLLDAIDDAVLERDFGDGSVRCARPPCASASRAR